MWYFLSARNHLPRKIGSEAPAVTHTMQLEETAFCKTKDVITLALRRALAVFCLNFTFIWKRENPKRNRSIGIFTDKDFTKTFNQILLTKILCSGKRPHTQNLDDQTSAFSIVRLTIVMSLMDGLTCSIITACSWACKQWSWNYFFQEKSSGYLLPSSKDYKSACLRPDNIAKVKWKRSPWRKRRERFDA